MDVNAPFPRDITDALVAVGPRLGIFGACFSWHEQASSTNDLAASKAQDGAPEGVVVAAGSQTSGRGRLGRSWASPSGAGVYASAILRPSSHIVSLVTIAAGVAVAEGIEAATGLGPTLKWPNDVQVGTRKLAGILAEAGGAGLGSPYVVLGFGINVTSAPYPPDVAARATSIQHELRRPCDRGRVLAECLAALADRYRALQEGQASGVTAAWRARAAGHLGREVEWDADGTTRRGIAEDIDPRGALLVRTDRGIVPVISGEVRWV